MINKSEPAIERLNEVEERLARSPIWKALIDGGLSLIPGLGQAISSALSTRAANLAGRRTTALIEEIRGTIGLFDAEKLDKTFLDSDEFTSLLVRTLELNARSSRAEKVRLFAAVFLGFTHSPGSELPFKEGFLRLVDELEPEHIAVLRIIHRESAPNRDAKSAGRARVELIAPGEGLTVTRRLTNFLSAARLYVDQVMHDLGSIFGKEHEILAAIERKCSEEYDAKLGFRLMETLRNTLQHRSISAIRLKYGTGVDSHSERPGVRTRVIPLLSISDLRECGIKASVQKELEGTGEHVEVTGRVREYMDGLAAVHYEFRQRALSGRERWESIVREAHARGAERWKGDGSRASDLVAIIFLCLSTEAVASAKLLVLAMVEAPQLQGLRAGIDGLCDRRALRFSVKQHESVVPKPQLGKWVREQHHPSPRLPDYS